MSSSNCASSCSCSNINFFILISLLKSFNLDCFEEGADLADFPLVLVFFICVKQSLILIVHSSYWTTISVYLSCTRSSSPFGKVFLIYFSRKLSYLSQATSNSFRTLSKLPTLLSTMQAFAFLIHVLTQLRKPARDLFWCSNSSTDSSIFSSQRGPSGSFSYSACRMMLLSFRCSSRFII